MTDPEQRLGYRQSRFSPPRDATTILLVRHGESAPFIPGELFDSVDGHADPPLAPIGRWQADQLAERLGPGGADAIYITTLQRTAQTAAPLARRLGLTPQIEPDLREVYLGEWEGGLYRQHVADGHPLAAAVLRAGRWDLIPGAESNEALGARVRRALEAIAAAHRGQRVVVVCHGGVIATALAYATGSSPFTFLGVDNASISEIVITGEAWHVRGFNERLHVADDPWADDPPQS
jgi:probable phosphoglycerate mutase